MRIIKKLSDWKTWLFGIIPIILYAVWFALMVYAYVRHINNPIFIIGSQIPFVVAILLLIGCKIFLQFKGKNFKNIICGIAGTLFLACFLGLQITQLTMIPKLCSTSQEADELYQIYKDTPYGDATYYQHQDEWTKANNEVADLSFKIGFITIGIHAAILFATLCCPHAKQKTDKSDNFSDLNTKI